MYILKDELVYNGDTVTLHVITMFNSDLATNTFSCELSSFKEGSPHPLIKRTYHYTHTEGSDHMQEAYGYIMSLPEWKSANLQL